MPHTPKQRGFGEFIRQLSQVAEEAFASVNNLDESNEHKVAEISQRSTKIAEQNRIRIQEEERTRYFAQLKKEEELKQRKAAKEEERHKKYLHQKPVATSTGNRYTKFLTGKKNNLRDAITLAEIIGPPRAFRDL